MREIVESKGHRIIYYPKYHCELNYIENVWAYLKSYLRRNCTYNFKDLKALIPVALDEVIPIAVFRRFARHCYRYMDGYEKGIEGPLLEFASKKYSSHRALPIGLTAAQVQIDLAEDKLAKRMRFKKQDKN